MSSKIKIRKGVNIQLVGAPADTVKSEKLATTYAVQPPNFAGLVPKLNVKEGDKVKAGSTLFFDKKMSTIKYASPVSGTVKSVVRGAKRRILSVIVESDGNDSSVDFGAMDPKNAKREELLGRILEGGMFAFFKQRPFDVIANPEETPRSIYVSGFDTNPLSASHLVALEGRMDDFQKGIDTLNTLAGHVHLGVNCCNSIYKGITGCEITEFEGPHPAGNVGVQIHHTQPINKGEVVWTINYQDVANLGSFLSTGKYNASRVIAVGGSEAPEAAHVATRAGACMCVISEVPAEALNGDQVRIISGSPLTGDKIEKGGHLGAFDTAVALIPEGHTPRFLLSTGWLSAGLERFSLSKAYFSWMRPKKQYTLDTNMGGEERAFVVTGEYEKVFPFEIYPVHLLKSILVNDIDAMEKLGIYEVSPEDFALCEYACTSKIPLQSIVREGLDTLRNELG